MPIGVRREAADDYVVLFLSGEITDDDCQELRRRVGEDIKEYNRVAIGLGEVKSLTTQVVVSLSLLGWTIRQRDGKLVFFSAPLLVRRMMQTCGCLCLETRIQALRYLQT